MNTIISLGIMIAAMTIGSFAIAIIILVMGLAGAPGALLYELGRKNNSSFLIILGLLLAGVGQAFIICAYTVFVVSIMRFYLEGHPNIPSWPLWIAAFFQSMAAPSHALKDRSAENTAQYMTLGCVGFAALIVFAFLVFVPESVKSIYFWVPFYENTIQG